MWQDWRNYMKTKRYFPMFIDMEDKKVVVVGGGAIATRRVRTLVEFTHNIYVIAPRITEDLDLMAVKGLIHIEKRPVMRRDFQMAFMVIAATDNGRLNDDIARICREEGIYVNVSTDKSKCDFYFPGIIKRDELVIGINASGVNHAKARQVRMELEEFFDKNYPEKKQGGFGK